MGSLQSWGLTILAGGGIGAVTLALVLIAMAYRRGQQAGRDAATDEAGSKVAGKTRKMEREILKERTASDVQKSLRDGDF